ncbi:MAG: acyltransferase [Lysobacteraceae bacterium]
MTASHEISRTHWARIGESTFTLGIWFLYGIHRVFGRWPFRLCLYPVVLAHWLLRPGVRQASMQYLQRLQAATGTLGREPSRRDSLRHVALFSETLLDKLLAVTGRYPFAKVRTQGREELYEYLSHGRGAMIITAHMGCMEMCRAMGEARGAKINILVHTRHAERFNRLLENLSPGHGVRLLEVAQTDPAFASKLAERIEAGELVAVAGDRVPVTASQTVEAQFLGHTAQFPVGPYVLAALLHCPLYLLTSIHEDDTYRIQMERIADAVVLPRANRAQALGELAQRYADALTQRLIRSPYDWFNFFPFWNRHHDRAPR